MRPIPLRNVIAFAVAAICVGLAISNYYEEISLQEAFGNYGFGAPPPPIGVFPFALLVVPGFLSGSFLIIAGAVMDLRWLLDGGQILGAIFFWYSVGWWIDCFRGSAERETPPVFVLIHLKALRIVSMILFPIDLWVGFNVGNSFCANNKPPFIPTLMIYGIQMVWVSIGAWFTLQNFRTSRQAPSISVISSGPSA